MGSNNYYGEANININIGNNNNHERGSIASSSSSSSSRKGKKGSSDKPKQPQRGLGVAQLEKIRLHSQLAPNFPSYHPSTFNHLQEEMTPQTPYSSSFYSSSSSPNSYGYGVMMGLPEINKTNIRYGDTQSNSIARWNPSGMGTQHFMEPIMTRPFFEPIVEGSSQKQNKMDWNGGQVPDSSSSEEIDLELRLSR
ncbi:hypothetical protein PHJA_001619000 [Phtheirospermum japonicum]|uniref:Uncharacterized protein n=1 Tax=Phtheirospermum japonicum TaxID=374723 RepID=A0A830C6I8_9LAMI|nr:hypothetical protein PHJA_001619000 [Phtheirospermum japonicum]